MTVPTPGTPLTEREREILELIKDGWTLAAIGHHLGISLRTVKAHSHNIRVRLRAASLPHAAAIDAEAG